MGGWCWGWQIGDHFSLSSKKFLHTFNSWSVASDNNTGSTTLLHAAKVLFRLNLKFKRNGDIWPTWFKLPISCCMSSNVVSSLFSMSEIDFWHFSIFSSGRRQERVSVLKTMPKTFPEDELEKAFSNNLQSGASTMLILLQMLLYVFANSWPHGEFNGATRGTSSSWRWTSFLGIAHVASTQALMVFPKMSKFWTDAAAPNICFSSMKNAPSQLKPCSLKSCSGTGTFF